ncbi:MAG: antibiotic biosynthesis monooxygenase family protein [Devosia sp.]
MKLRRSVQAVALILSLSGATAMANTEDVATTLPSVDDLIAPIRAMVRDPDKAFDIFIKITLIPGQEEAFENAFASRMAATREEPGNILFELSRHPDMANVYMLHERWASLAAVERHMSLPHMASFWPIYFPMIARVPEFEIYATRDLVNGSQR